MQDEEALPVRSRSRSTTSLVLGGLATIFVIAGFVGVPHAFAPGPLPALLALFSVLIGAFLARSSVSLFALVLVLFSIAAPAAVILFAFNPAALFPMILDPTTSDRLSAVVRWVWVTPALAAALTLVVDGWQE
jgi:hypothetical protein